MRQFFSRQARYQYAILCFDKELGNNEEAFGQLAGLQHVLEEDSLLNICAAYNLGLATFNGLNSKIRSGDILETAKIYWLKAAGGTKDSLSEPTNVKAMDIFGKGPSQTLTYDSEVQFYRSLAQSKLGQLYSFDSPFQSHEKSFFWHTEAAGNGNIESQGTIGVMYLFGIGVRKNEKSGVYCLKHAASHNDYALGRLCEYYYKKKMFSHCLEFSKEYAIKFLLESQENLIESIRTKADKYHCTMDFSVKGSVLCAFYFARCLEQGYITEDGNARKNSLATRRTLDLQEVENDSSLLQNITDGPMKIFRNCAKMDPGLMVDLQAQRTHALL